MLRDMDEPSYPTWYEMTRQYTLRLVQVASVSPGEGEVQAAREVLRLLHDGGLASHYLDSGLEPLPGDPYGRRNAYALLRGRSPLTVVLLGHLDTVGTQDYGALEPWARDPAGLAARSEVLAAADPSLAADLRDRPGDWMLGRGVADMKSGVAATIAVMRHLAERAHATPPPLSVVLLATPDEENELAGVIAAVDLLLRLRDRYGLTYVGAINTDYTGACYVGDPHRYIYMGTTGKLLPSFFIAGRPSHAGAPFAGLDPNLVAAELIRDLSMCDDLCDTVGEDTTPPPVTLHATDLKSGYDTQLPFAAYFYLNVLTLTTEPRDLIERLRGRAQAALSRMLARVDAAEGRWLQRSGAPVSVLAAPRGGAVLTYEELHAMAVRRVGMEQVSEALSQEWELWPASLDKRERCLHLVRRLWTLGGLEGPAVVIYYAPPYLPHLAPVPGALDQAVAAVVDAHAALNILRRPYFPLLSDMSYLRLDPMVDLTALQANMPVWQNSRAPHHAGSYSLPLEAMRALSLPTVNIGPYGRDVHQPGERVLMSYSFGVVPHLLHATIEQLAHLLTEEQA